MEYVLKSHHPSKNFMADYFIFSILQVTKGSNIVPDKVDNVSLPNEVFLYVSVEPRLIKASLF